MKEIENLKYNDRYIFKYINIYSKISRLNVLVK